MKMPLATEIALAEAVVILLWSFVHSPYYNIRCFTYVSESKVTCRVHAVWPRENHSWNIS